MYNFGFGDSVAVNNVLIDVFGIAANCIDDFHPTYPPVEGDKHLTDLTRKLIKRQTNRDYKHVLLTHGATGAINTLLRVLGEHGAGVHFDPLHFIYYPKMVRRLGMLPVTQSEFLQYDSCVHLTASPSNPDGEIKSFGDAERTIWDAVYSNEVYSDMFFKPPPHIAMVGSYSKYLGLNGARVGWLATDDDALYTHCIYDALYEGLGVNTLGTHLVTQILHEGEWEMPGYGLEKMIWFEIEARRALDDNRTEMQKLEYLFNRVVPSRGMFFFSEADAAARSLLAKAQVKFIDGVLCGGAQGSVRLTLGQDRELTKQMVKAILREDGK